jgi:hypothetical protein
LIWLHSVEEADWAHLGKVRIALEKRLRSGKQNYRPGFTGPFEVGE